jgi:tellurite resistance protein TerC
MALAQHAPDPEKNLIITLARRLLPVAQNLDGEWLVVRIEGKLVFTPLALALIMIETSDLIFAVDSVPAIFAITSDPFLVFTSNIMAVLGLRSLYFALAGVIDRLRYLRLTLALLLALIGTKFLLKDILPSGPDTVQYTLGVVALILAGGLAASLICAQRTSESCHLEIPARRGVMNRGNR